MCLEYYKERDVNDGTVHYCVKMVRWDEKENAFKPEYTAFLKNGAGGCYWGDSECPNCCPKGDDGEPPCDRADVTYRMGEKHVVTHGRKAIAHDNKEYPAGVHGYRVNMGRMENWASHWAAFEQGGGTVSILFRMEKVVAVTDGVAVAMEVTPIAILVGKSYASDPGSFIPKALLETLTPEQIWFV